MDDDYSARLKAFNESVQEICPTLGDASPNYVFMFMHGMRMSASTGGDVGRTAAAAHTAGYFDMKIENRWRAPSEEQRNQITMAYMMVFG